MDRFTRLLPLVVVTGVAALVQLAIEAHLGSLAALAFNGLAGAVVLLCIAAMHDAASAPVDRRASAQTIGIVLGWIAVPYSLAVALGVVLRHVTQEKFGADAAEYHQL